MIKWIGDKLGYRVFTLEEFELHSQVNDKTLENTKLALDLERDLTKKLSAEVEYYRNRYDEALERADRAQDALNQSNGLPEVTTTVRRERKEQALAAADDIEKRQSELNEIFAESLGMLHDVEGLELPEDLRDAASAMIAPAKKA